MTRIQKELEVINIFKELEKKKSVLTTSAGVTSLVIIDLLNRANVKIPIVFIDTGFLFEKTLNFFAQFKIIYPELKFITLSSENIKQEFLKNGLIKDTNACCQKNKVDILHEYLARNKITHWVSAPRRDQTIIRENLKVFEKVSKGITKVYPMLEWTEEEMLNYLKEKKLPLNPLYYEGYESIGCYPCTKKGQGRDGRWNGKKTECGLHVEK